MIKRILIAILLFVFPSGYAASDIVVDAGAGPAAGISVTSGTSVTVDIFFIPGTSAVAFDGVGLDLSWTATGSAAAALTGPGFLAGLATGPPSGATIDDLFAPVGAGSVVPGALLVNTLLPPGTSNVGGGTHYDTVGMAVSGGTSYGVLAGTTPLDLMGASFTVTGSPGDTITFTPSGILPVPTGSFMTPGAWTPVSGGSTYYVDFFGTGVTTTDPNLVPVTVTIVVPEPSSMMLFGFGCLLLASRQKRA